MNATDNGDDAFLKKMQSCALPAPSEELKARILKDAASLMRPDGEEASPEDVRRCLKFLLASAAALAVAVLAGAMMNCSRPPSLEKAAPSIPSEPCVEDIGVHLRILPAGRAPVSSQRCGVGEYLRQLESFEKNIES